jgi:hypothetical protein
MNTLEFALAENKHDEKWAMNLLQAHGIISDNCVTAADVAAPDCFDAMKFLMRRPPFENS